jgi:uncharacterized protein (TIRG00374 family)
MAIETLPEKVRSTRLGLRLGVRGLFQVTIGVGALALILVRSDSRSLLEALKSTHFSYFPLAFVATLAVYWLMAYRWGMILATRGYQIKSVYLFAYHLIGVFFGNFVPGGAVSTDLARLIYADRDVRDKAFVLSTLVYEKLVGLFTALLVGLLATLMSRSYLPEGQMVYIAEAALALGFLASVSVMSDYLSSRLASLVTAMSKRMGLERLGSAAARTMKAMSELRRYHGMVAGTIALTILVRIVWSLGFYVTARAMELPLSLPLVFAFTSLVDLVRMLPISVNGLGLREWLLIALFANVGIAREQALMFSFLAFAPLMLAAILGGIIYIMRAGRKSRIGGRKWLKSE